MTAAKTNESPVRARKGGQHGPSGEQVRATAKYIGTSAYKMRVVLNLIRGHKVADAADILRLCERDAAITIGKVLRSAVANAVANDGMSADELYVSACYADEGPTVKRFTPRARGRTGKILHRSSHITVLVSQLPENQLGDARAAQDAAAEARARRTAGNKAAAETSAADTRRAASGTTESVAGVGAVVADEASVESAVAESAVAESAVVESAVTQTVESAEIQSLVSATATVDSTDGDAASVSTEASAAGADHLNQIIGIGPKLELELNAAGISTFAQLAALTDDEITALDEKVTRSADQIKEWRTQAQQILDGTWVDTSTKNT
jgi:large subunit ribosomal protein L22